MKQTQHQTMRQKMSLTQQMRSSLSLLQMGADEIASALEEETRRNPFLRPLPTGGSLGGGGNGGDTTAPEAPARETTSEQLLHQVALIRFSREEQQLATQLVYCLDERGFFADPLSEMCGYLDARPDSVLSVVAKLQEAVEPAGIFVWTLAESFAAQLRSKNRYDPMIAELLGHMELIVNRDLDGICTLCGVDREDAEDMLDDIRSLTPAPLSPAPEIGVETRAPDLIIRRTPEGEILAALNPNALPDMLTDDALFSTIKTNEPDATSFAYYRECYRSAGAFVVAMQKRANTLLKIGQLMAKTQDKFFQTGRPLDRKPLTMGGLARDLGMNKSTVSRALSNCLIDSDHGTLPASQLLVRPLSDDAGQKTRDQALKRLALIIRTEDKDTPLSDQQLSLQMGRVNLPISRRTVAKYRDILGIPNALERREKPNLGR